MLSVAEASARLASAARLLAASEELPLERALGCTLAADLRSSVAVPPADNSAMDGYAFALEEARRAGFRLPVSQRVPAGRGPRPLEPGTAARVFTGAELPPGADTVAMQESCKVAGDDLVQLPADLAHGDHVRKRGEDIPEGRVILRAGVRLRPQELGLIASVGRGTVPVYRPLRVAVLCTGDELVHPGKPLGPGQIYNSNRFLLGALLDSLGMEPVALEPLPDDARATRDGLTRATAVNDVVVTVGGVSVGEEDHVRAAVESLGSLDFWRVAIKPGKPMATGHIEGTPFIGLPGNPASVFVTFLMLARPFLLACQGRTDTAPVFLRSRALFEKEGESREVYLRGRLREEGVAIYPQQGSGVLNSAVWGDVLVRQPAGEAISTGLEVDVLPFDMLLR